METRLKKFYEGKYRGEMMYGSTYLPSFDIDVTVAKRPLKNYSGRFARLLYAFYLLWESRFFDMIYSPYYMGLEYVIKLRALRLFPKKLMIWHHNPIREVKGIGNKLFYRGIDVAFFFSQPIIDECHQSGLRLIRKSHVLNWGPDLQFYNNIRLPFEKTKNGPIIMSGQDSRDFNLLLQVCQVCKDLEFEVYPPNDEIASMFSEIGQHVKVGRVDKNFQGYYELSKKTARASLVLILTKPIRERELPSGLTSICEATGLGKPCIITDNKYFSSDMRSAGFAKFVEVGDFEGVVSSIKMVINDERLRRNMSEAAIQYANKNNLTNMTKELSVIMKKSVYESAK